MKPFNTRDPIEVNKMKSGDHVLHGDVVVTAEKCPDGFEQWPFVEDSCLAYGEATGHAHKLFDGEFELRENPKTRERHLRVVSPTALRHQEHREIKLPPGDYRIGIQKEYDPFTKKMRSVYD